MVYANTRNVISTYISSNLLSSKLLAKKIASTYLRNVIWRSVAPFSEKRAWLVYGYFLWYSIAKTRERFDIFIQSFSSDWMCFGKFQGNH